MAIRTYIRRVRSGERTVNRTITMGTFGELVFQSGMKKTMMPTGFSQEVGAKWSSVETPGSIEQSEFISPQARTLKFDVQFSAGLGINPTQMMDKVRHMVETGEHYKLILGGKPVSGMEWYIESASESWDIVTARGKIYSAKVSLSLKQYR